MTLRALNWNDLCRVAGLRDPASRLVTVAGIPARVVPVRGSDPGFKVRGDAERLDGKWELRGDAALPLLRELVANGQVTWDDPDVPAEPARCFIDGCPAPDVDPRGPVRTRDGGEHPACPAHWAAIFTLLGQLDADRARTEESTCG